MPGTFSEASSPRAPDALTESSGQSPSPAIPDLLSVQRRAGNRAAATLVERLAIQRRTGATPTFGQAPQALELPPGDNLQATVAVMRAVDGLKPAADGAGRFVTTYQGRELSLAEEQVSRLRSTAADALHRALARSVTRRDSALGRYQQQEAVNRDFPATSAATKVFSWVKTFGAYRNPGDAIRGQSAHVDDLAAQANAEIDAGKLESAVADVAAADAAAERAAKLASAYADQLTGDAGNLATGLEYTRDAALLTLGVLSAIVSGGAAAGLAPGVIGTGIGGASAATTGVVLATGAPIAANVGQTGMKAALGEKIDWAEVTVDTAVQIVLARFGGRLAERLYGRLAGNPAVQTLARRAVASLVSGVATHEVSQAFAVIVRHTYRNVQHRESSWAGFEHDLVTNLSDPKGLFLAAVMAGAQLGAHRALESATPVSPTSNVTPEPTAPQPEEAPVSVNATTAAGPAAQGSPEPNWDELIAGAELPTQRQSDAGYRVSPPVRSGDHGVVIVEGRVGPKVSDSERISQYAATLPGEHATHPVGMQQGENTAQEASAPAEYNLSSMKTVENTIRSAADAAAGQGAEVETRTIFKLEYRRVGADEVKVVVGVQRTASLRIPGSDRDFEFVDVEDRIDPITREVTNVRLKIIEPRRPTGR